MEGSTSDLRAELVRARAAGRVHSAYLFEGLPDAEASETALWFARMLLCGAGADGPCEGCHACTLSRPAQDEGPRHPDFHAIRAENGVLRIDAVRGLRRALGLASHQQGRRVGLIEDADQLNAQAANALLKMLEEPPAQATLILVATNAAALPPTVRSRLTYLRFAPRSEAELRRALEESGLDAADAELAASVGSGSLEAARRWVETELDSARSLRHDLEALAEQPASAVLELAERFRGSGAREEVLLFFDVHAAVTLAALRRAVADGDTRATERSLARLDAAQRIRRELVRRNLNPQLAVEALLLS